MGVDLAGESAAGLALRRADAAQVAGLRGRGDFDFGAGHRGEYRAIFGRQRRVAESLAVPASKSAGGFVVGPHAGAAQLDSLSEFSRLAEGEHGFFLRG